MRTYLVAFLLSFGVAAGLTPVLCGLAAQIGGIDRAGSARKVHTEPMPRLGGLAIVLGFFAPLVGLFMWENAVSTLFLSEPGRVVGLFVGGIGIAALGLYDDLRGLNARSKLVGQVLVATFLFELGYRIEAIGNPFGDQPILLGQLAWPITVLWLVGIVNAVNLIDGLDGLAGGVSGIVVALTFAMAFSRPDVLMCLFTAALGGAVVGFLFYNLSPAIIFMGDTGSMFLGFVLGAASLATSEKRSTAVALLVPIVALGLPITDTLLAVLRRALRGQPVFSADRDHIHHRLLSLGLSQRQTVLVLYAVCLVLAVGAVLLAFASAPVAAVTLTVLAALGGAGLRRLGYLELTVHGVQGLLADRHRNRRLHVAVRGSLGALQAAREVDDLPVTLAPFALAVGARSVSVSLTVGGDGRRRQLGWSQDVSDPERRIDMRRPLAAGGGGLPEGELIVTWLAVEGEHQRDLEIAVDQAAHDVAATLARIFSEFSESERIVRDAGRTLPSPVPIVEPRSA